jgi:hypothetical protein
VVPPTPHRVRLPASPLAGATTGVGRVRVTVLLTFDGTLDVHCRAADVDLLAALADGLFVSGLDSPSPVVHAAAGHRFTQLRTTFQPPGTMAFEGDSSLRLRGAEVEADGTPGYRLEVRAEWAGSTASAPPCSAAEWSDHFGSSLAAIGVIVLGRARAEELSTG